jgi:hypothetical protein
MPRTSPSTPYDDYHRRALFDWHCRNAAHVGPDRRIPVDLYVRVGRLLADAKATKGQTVALYGEVFLGTGRRDTAPTTDDPPWDEDDLEHGLPPLPRRLLEHMLKHELADLTDLAEQVWGKARAKVTDTAVQVAVSKVNMFLNRYEHRRRLSKEGEAVLWV